MSQYSFYMSVCVFYVIFVAFVVEVSCLPFGIAGGHGKDSHEPPPQLICPSPFELEGEVCKTVSIVEATYTCDKLTGYFENGQCITISESPAVSKCPDGGEFDGKKCVLANRVPAAVYCAKGFSTDTDATGCISQTVRKAHQKCPSGFSGRNGQCRVQKFAPAAPICPAGFVIQTGGHNLHIDCVLVDLVGQIPNCPRDYELEGNFCAYKTVTEPLPNCALRFSPDGEFCSRTIKVEPDAVCPNGQLGASKKDCLIVDVGDHPKAICKKDFTLDGNLCVKLQESHIHLGCPQGFRLLENMCVLQEDFTPEYSCPNGMVLNDKFCTGVTELPFSYRCAKGELTPDQKCVHSEKTKSQTVCLPGYTMRGGDCISTRSVAAEIKCESGELEGKSCISHISVPAEKYCKDGAELISGNCVRTEKKSKHLGCPKGFKLQNDSCFSHAEDEMEHACPEGTINKGRTCEIHTTVLPIFYCPRHFMMDQAGSCFMSEFAEPSVRCPDGHRIFQGQCVHSKNGHSHSKLRSLKLNLSR